MDFGCCKVVALCDTERGVVMPQKSIRLSGKPAWVAEFERNLKAAIPQSRGGEQVVEACEVEREVWRKLEEERAELVGLPRWSKRCDELSDCLMASAKALEVSDSLRSFETEAEPWRCRFEPSLQLRLRRKRPKGVIHFNRCQARGVDMQKGARGNIDTIKTRLPCRVGPAGSSGKEVAWRRR